MKGLHHRPENIDGQPHLHRDCEVDDCDLDADLWQVVRVRHLGGDEELEVGVVIYVAVSQADERAAALLVNGLCGACNGQSAKSTR